MSNQERTITTTYAIDFEKRKVVMQFSQTLANLSFVGAEAANMAKILLNCARELDPESVKGFTWPEMEKPIQKSPIAEQPGQPS